MLVVVTRKMITKSISSLPFAIYYPKLASYCCRSCSSSKKAIHFHVLMLSYRFIDFYCSTFHIHFIRHFGWLFSFIRIKIQKDINRISIYNRSTDKEENSENINTTNEAFGSSLKWFRMFFKDTDHRGIEIK